MKKGQYVLVVSNLYGTFIGTFVRRANYRYAFLHPIKVLQPGNRSAISVTDGEVFPLPESTTESQIEAISHLLSS